LAFGTGQFRYRRKVKLPFLAIDRNGEQRSSCYMLPSMDFLAGELLLTIQKDRKINGKRKVCHCFFPKDFSQ